jgi:hypothetical protein
MVETHVLRFPISGQEDGSFLLEVSSNGSRPLDLKLMGSESTAVFFAKRKFYENPHTRDQVIPRVSWLRRPKIELGQIGGPWACDIHANACSWPVRG